VVRIKKKPVRKIIKRVKESKKIPDKSTIRINKIIEEYNLMIDIGYDSDYVEEELARLHNSSLISICRVIRKKKSHKNKK
jgi:hypothetical protein